MQSILGFTDSSADIVDRSSGSKLVPWISWDEWNSVKESLFSSSPASVASALQRITAWRSRGCLPVVVEITASIIEIQQKDPYFSSRDDLNKGGLDSEEVMAMLYTMAIMRLVNGVVEKTRKKTEVSIGEAADVIDIPRMLIDIRHEGSHRDLPSLRLTRIASIKAIDWLKSYYWEPQRAAIFFQADGTANIRKEIKSRLRELASCLEVKQVDRSGSLSTKEKRIKHCEMLCGRNKFLSLTAGKPQSSKYSDSKKQIRKALKHVIRLYSSYSSEVVSVFIELLLKCSDSTNLTSLSEGVSGKLSNTQKCSGFDEWKHVVSKLSDKEPLLVVTLIKAVLTKIGERGGVCTNGSGEISRSENTDESHRTKRLSDLCEWLIRNMKELKGSWSDESAAVSEGSPLLKKTIVELFRQALLVSNPGNDQLLNSAVILAHAMGNSLLVQKLEKLRLFGSLNPGADVEFSPTVSSEKILAQQEDFIRQAAQKLEAIKLHRTKNVPKETDFSAGTETNNSDKNNRSRWVVAKSWSACPIGMLPSDVGFSGSLPLLDCEKSGNQQNDYTSELLLIECEEHGTLENSSRKRPSISGDFSDASAFKKKREIGNFYKADTAADEPWTETGTTGHLMIGGVWKKVGAEELHAIASGVRILV